MYNLSEKSGTDIDAILDYSFINFGTEAMLKYHKSLEKCFVILEKNPDLGMKIEHIHHDYWCFQHHAHLIFYKKRTQGILIIRILHKSMDAKRHFN